MLPTKVLKCRLLRLWYVSIKTRKRRWTLIFPVLAQIH